MCFGNALGFDFADDLTEEELFSRTFGAVIVAVPNDGNAVDKIKMTGGKFLGTTTSDPVFRYKDSEASAGAMAISYEGKLERIFPTFAADAYMKREVKFFKSDKSFKAAPGVLKGAKPKVIIPAFPGTNCEIDSARAFERAGAYPEVFVIRNMTSDAITDSLKTLASKINESNIIMLPGGFSAGDEPEGSAKFLAAAFRNPYVTDAVRDLLNNRDGLMIGICNGFQALIKLGLLPYGDIKELTDKDPTLTFNNIGRHQSSYVNTMIMSNNSPWLTKVKVGDVFSIPVSHGEGRFVASNDILEGLINNGQIATCYVSDDGSPASTTDFNPNGSDCAIEGILSPDGRILGKMGHSERYAEDLSLNIPGNKDQKLFESGVAYFL